MMTILRMPKLMMKLSQYMENCAELATRHVKEGKDKGKPVRMNHYEDCLHDVLLEVQRVLDLIP